MVGRCGQRDGAVGRGRRGCVSLEPALAAPRRWSRYQTRPATMAQESTPRKNIRVGSRQVHEQAAAGAGVDAGALEDAVSWAHASGARHNKMRARAARRRENMTRARFLSVFIQGL